MNTISRSDLKRLIDKQEDALIVNVLPEEKFRERHIPSSINIPFKDNENFVEKVVQRAGSKDQRVVVYCANTQCNLSPNAARKLQEAGFTNVQDYEEGTEGWFSKESHEAAA